MKLLFDQNISHKLVDKIGNMFPNSSHVKKESLDTSSDERVWDFARYNNFIIVSKDSDFIDKSIVRGFPPKIIWINKGNCSSKVIENILRDNFLLIKNFSEEQNTSLLILI